MDTGGTADLRARAFSSIESSVLRRARIDEADASGYPDHVPVKGIVELIAAGVAPEVVASADPALSATAVVAFLGAGHALDDTDYDARFLDPKILSEQGIPASMANAYPSSMNEVDVLRLHDVGATPDVATPFGDDWPVEDVAALVSAGVSADEARPFRTTSFVPSDAIAGCLRAEVEPEVLDRWLEVVGPAVRTSSRTLVTMALENDRLGDPERFRDELLRVAIASIDSTDTPEPQRGKIVDALLAILGRGGDISTSVPSPWNRQRLLHVGPPVHERAVVTVLPDEPVRFAYGAVDLDRGLAALQAYAAELDRAPTS